MSETPITDVLAEARRLEGERTKGPWEVLAEPHPQHPAAIERRIITTWHHPQLKGPCPVVNHATVRDGKMQVSIDAPDAAFIAFWGTHAPAVLAYVGELEQELAQFRGAQQPYEGDVIDE